MPQRYPKRVAGFRSGLEQTLAAELDAVGVEYEYEPKDQKVRYSKPERDSTYLPDFDLRKTRGFIIEGKGRFTATDRAKFLLIKQSNPSIDIRFVFNRSKTRLSKTSKTTYADWCRKHGFLFADEHIPKEWIK